MTQFQINSNSLTRPKFEREMASRLDPWELDENGIYRLRVIENLRYRSVTDWAKEGPVRIVEIDEKRRGDNLRLHLQEMVGGILVGSRKFRSGAVDINVDGFIYERNVVLRRKVAGYFMHLVENEGSLKMAPELPAK